MCIVKPTSRYTASESANVTWIWGPSTTCRLLPVTVIGRPPLQGRMGVWRVREGGESEVGSYAIIHYLCQCCQENMENRQFSMPKYRKLWVSAFFKGITDIAQMNWFNTKILNSDSVYQNTFNNSCWLYQILKAFCILYSTQQKSIYISLFCQIWASHLNMLVLGYTSKISGSSS